MSPCGRPGEAHRAAGDEAGAAALAGLACVSGPFWPHADSPSSNTMTAAYRWPMDTAAWRRAAKLAERCNMK